MGSSLVIPRSPKQAQSDQGEMRSLFLVMRQNHVFRGSAGWCGRYQDGLGKRPPTSPSAARGSSLAQSRKGGNSCCSEVWAEDQPAWAPGRSLFQCRIRPLRPLSLSAQMPGNVSRAGAQGPRHPPPGDLERESMVGVSLPGRGCRRDRGRPAAARRAGRAAAGAALQAGPEVPDLCWVLVPGTSRPLDGKFLAGRAPGPQFE